MKRAHLRRKAAFVAASSALALSVTTPAMAATTVPDGDVQVVNAETVQVYLNASGSPQTKRVYEQLTMSGKGKVDLTNPIATQGLRNLDGFGGFEVKDGKQVVRTSVDGEKKLRSVSDYKKQLPLEVRVEYKLDGSPVSPGRVVGKNGHLKVTFYVKNVTSQPQEVQVPDGRGGTVTRTDEVAIPMVGSLTTTTPPNFTNVASSQANMAGDGKGGSKLSFTMTLFPPIGSADASFGYDADIADGVVPRVEISALPVNPLESPTFSSAAKSYQGGADTGLKLAEGASEIDSNLLKLRDGAADLLAGLIKLRDGAGELSDGLTNRAEPGAVKASKGARALATGLVRLEDGAVQLSAGTGDLQAGAESLSTGSSKLNDGAGKLATGAGALADGTGSAATGGEKLKDGLSQISGGLNELSNASAGLPKAQDGIAQLQAGVDQIIEGFGTTEAPGTLLNGIAQLDDGLSKLHTGATGLVGGLQQVGGGLPRAKGGVDAVKAGLDASVANNGSLDQLLQGLGAVKANFCATHQTLAAQCAGTVDQLIGGVQQSKTNLGAASSGLGQVSSGLDDAIAGIQGQLIPGAQQLAGGLSDAQAGAQKLGGGAAQLKSGAQRVRDGLGELEVGITKAVAGVLSLSTGAGDAYSGSSTLSAGLTKLDSGAGQLAGGTEELATGTGKLTVGAQKLAAGSTKLNDGADKLATGAGDARDGSSQLADGVDQLSAGIKDAGDGSSLIFGGLTTAAGSAPQLTSGAQRLSDEGTKKLVAAGESTAMSYGEMVAVMTAGAKRADTESMATGAPADAIGLTAYSYTLKGADGEGSRNTFRILGGAVLIGAAGGVLFLRRRFLV